MKKLYFLFAAFAPSLLLAQANCNAGYETPTFTGTQSVPANIVVTLTVTVTNPGTLTDVSISTTGLSNANIKACVYDDNSGVPGNLIASSSPVLLTNTPGTITLPVTPVYVTAGTYHIGAIIDQSGSAIWVDGSTSQNFYAYPMSFSSNFPATGSGFATISGNVVNIWMNIICDGAGVEDHSAALSLNSSPNPVEDQLWLQFHSTTSRSITAVLYSACGELVSENALNIAAGESSSSIDMSGLSSGIYFIRLSDENGLLLTSGKVIKQ